MKYIILAFLLSGCATVGTVLKAAGDGMAHASNQQTHYSPDLIGGFNGDNGAHCSPDLIGGYNCD